MGIEYEDMRSILTALKQEVPLPGSRLLILGDAHIHFTVDMYVALANELGYSLSVIPQILDPYTLGKSLGFGLVDTLDINGKASITIDLQQQMPESLMGKFDCLIDAGVLFWCYDPGAALRNIFRLVKENGLIIHITAVSGHYGRGYYNIHPRLFEDFYSANNCQYIHATYRTKPQQRSILARICSIFGLPQKSIPVHHSYCEGNIYLNKSHCNEITFCKEQKIPESSILPNNVVGTFVFRKLAGGEPKGPIQLC